MRLYFLIRLVVASALLTAPAFAERWKIQYFFDEARMRLSIDDLAFPSEKRGIAIGTIFNERENKAKFTTLVTSDGGENWTQIPQKEHGRSLFFLNENAGWMVTDDAIWFTEESGRSWKKLSEQPKAPKKSNFRGGLIETVWFLDQNRGFAAGYFKTAYATSDGGRTWKPIEAASTPNSNPLYSAFTRISFAPERKRGMMIGSYSPPQMQSRYRPNLPSWMEPETAAKRRQVPRLTMLLETRDGGNKWEANTAPLFGTITTLRMQEKEALTVFQFNESFEWPAEVYRIDLLTGVSVRVFREKDRRVTDALLFPGSKVVMAAVEPPGKLNSAPIPGKVKIITSSDFKTWKESDVDYKAEAGRVKLAGPDPDHLWAATDTGMILRLVK
ncbi:MAG TPA: hypothetical protein VE958_11735 [Bryobacteraceae bacterium]|nr:hypothetical protein [Bryobacteraceae bacterium]